MKTVKGNKQIEIRAEEFEKLLSEFTAVEIDLGTGDGRFVYKNALENPSTLYIGIDPIASQLKSYAKKANRKKLKNALFVIGSVEKFPSELDIKFEKLYVNFPWGSLLQEVVKPTENIISIMRNAKTTSFILGYNEDAEPSESERLNLPEINEQFFEETLAPIYNKNGFQLIKIEKINKKELAKYETSWSKKLKYGTEREFFKLEMKNRIQ